MPWFKAKTPIKVLDADKKGAKPRIVGENDAPFELDEDSGADLVASGAAVAVDAPAPAAKTPAPK